MDEAVRYAIQMLDEGQLVVYPTDTLYGLGCRAQDPEAFERLRRIKGLPEDRGVSAVFGSLHEARAWAHWTPAAAALDEAFLPGPLTLILDATHDAPDHLLSPQGTLGVRYVDREATLQLCGGGPVVSTSANRHGKPSVTTSQQAREVFGDQVAAYVDAGRLDGPASTVVDARARRPKIIRVGAIAESDILEAMPRGR